MTIEECYSDIGGDYRDVLRRFGEEDRVKRFLLRFPNEESYSSLIRAMEARDTECAFRAAHSLKGVSVNLGLTSLYRSSAALTEELRGLKLTPAAEKLAAQVTRDYGSVLQAIREFTRSEEPQKEAE